MTRRATLALTSVALPDWLLTAGASSVDTGTHERTPGVKVREAIKLLRADGWFLVRTRGDHRQYHHPTKPGTVTVAGKLRVDIPPKTLKSILRQAGLEGNAE